MKTKVDELLEEFKKDSETIEDKANDFIANGKAAAEQFKAN